MRPPAAKSNPWPWLMGGFFLIATLMVGMLILVAAMSGGGRSGGGLAGFGRDGEPVGLVTLRGPIDDVVSRRVLDELWGLANDDDIHALVLRIDSPGGQVGPSQELYTEVARIRKESGKPVIASMASMAASGGYYAALGCDRIFANPGTITASIGVILMTTHGPDLLDEANVEVRTYKSGALKDAGAFTRAPSARDRAFFDETVADLFEQFQDHVKEARGLDDAGIAPVSDGRVVSGRRALELKLIDELGGLAEAGRKALELAGVESRRPRFVTPREDIPPWVKAVFRSASHEASAAMHRAARSLTTGPGATIEYRAPLGTLR